DLGLTAETRLGLELVRGGDALFFFFVDGRQVGRPIDHVHVAGGAGAETAAGVLQRNVVIESDVENAFAHGGLNDHVQGHKTYFRHYYYSQCAARAAPLSRETRTASARARRVRVIENKSLSVEATRKVQVS